MSDFYVNPSGIIHYYLPGTYVFHKENGPAVISDTHVSYYINGHRYRKDGPAYIDKLNGQKFYHLKDNYYSEAEYFKKIAK